MQYVRSISGSVSKTWNSINPATLSGAIDVIVVEHADGSLSCSPFHVRFGKFSLLRPSEKKVEFRVSNIQQDYAMKLGEGGEAFFVFETSAHIPQAMQTSPLVSPVSSPETRPSSSSAIASIQELEPLDLTDTTKTQPPESQQSPPMLIPERRTNSDTNASQARSFPDIPTNLDLSQSSIQPPLSRSTSPPPLPKQEALHRAMTLSQKLRKSNIPSQVNDEGDLMLDMTGYKSSEEETLRAEIVARQILSEELEGNYDIGSLIGADEKGNLWIYSSEEAKDVAARKTIYTGMPTGAMLSTDAISDPGYHTDDNQSQKDLEIPSRNRRESDSALGSATPPDSPHQDAIEPSRNYAKTLRLTSDQLKALNLKPGPNPMSFSVNRATCTAYMYLWQHHVPIVVSDVDGTITKSDALGHVLNMIGRDWTHLGVAKLYCDIVANGYNIMYLTSRSVGQADTTRTYLNGIVQEGYKLPRGPVIMSPDRTMAALRREVYLRKPEVFKMACLRDIMSLFAHRKSPFYAGFGNRLTDALSYRSVNIPSTRIFTINSNAEVSLDLLSLNKYKTGYTSMRETVDHFFPPVAMLIQEGGEEYTDFNYWRDQPIDMDLLSLTDSDGDDDPRYDDGSDDDDILSDGLADSYMSRDSVDDALGVRRSIESDDFSARRGSTRRGEQMVVHDADDRRVQDLNALDLIAVAAGPQETRRARAASERLR